MSARIVLTGLSTNLAGLTWETGDHLRIGRQGSMDIVLQDPSVGQQHAEVFVTAQGWMIRQLNGGKTFVNGVPVGDKPRRLQPEDVLQLGKTSVKVSSIAEQARPITLSPAQPNVIKTTGPLVRVEASSQRSWEQGLSELDDSSGGLANGKQFLTLLRGGHPFSHIDNLDQLLQSFLEDALGVFGAQRGAILLLDGNNKLMLRACAFAKTRAKPAKWYSTTLAEHCFFQTQSLLCANVSAASVELGPMNSAMRGEMGSIICALLRSPRRRLGVLHLDRGTFDEPFTEEILSLADSVAATIAVPIEAALEVEKQWQALSDQSLAVAELALEAHDQERVEHSRRFAELASNLARHLELPRGELHQLCLAALLHEVGGLTSPSLAALLPILRHIHERWDGTGLPDGLAGDAIPRASRILAVAHAADEQLMRTQGDWTRAVERLKAESGRAFDPEYIATLLQVRPR